MSGTSSFTSGANAITLTNTSNALTGAVTLSNSGANDVSLTNNRLLSLGNVGVGTGTLTLTGVGISQVASTAITQAAAAGAVSFVGGAGVLTLANTGNSFTGAVSLSNSGANACELI